MHEFEVKFLDIDPAAVIKQVTEAGGNMMYDRIFHRRVFDYPGFHLDKQGAWVRVRDEGDKITLAFKQRLYDTNDALDHDDSGMIEEEVEVSNFETTCTILRHIGLIDKFFIENRRIEYKLDGVRVDIDYWPLIPPYLEIEGENWEDVNATIEKLGLNPADKKIYSATQVYAHYGINDQHYSSLTFDNVARRES
jgi:adenylate cyclase class 2